MIYRKRLMACLKANSCSTLTLKFKQKYSWSFDLVASDSTVITVIKRKIETVINYRLSVCLENK